MSLSNPPEVALWLRVPDSCRMRGEFEIAHRDLPEVHVILGGTGDDTHLLFGREALERFVELARRMLALPVTVDGPVPDTVLESNRGYPIREERRFYP